MRLLDLIPQAEEHKLMKKGFCPKQPLERRIEKLAIHCRAPRRSFRITTEETQNVPYFN